MMKTRLSVLAYFLLASGVGWGQMQVPPETRNAALRYWQAFAEMKDPPTDVPTREAIEKVVWLDAEWDEPKLGPIITQNEFALGIMQRATKLPDCDWGVEYSQGAKAPIGFVSKARVLARLNTLNGIRELHLGHRQAAADSWIAGIRFSRDLAKGGSLLFAGVASTLLREEMHTLETAVKRGRFSTAQKNQLRAAISALPEDGVDWAQAWEMESVGIDWFAAEMQRSSNPARLYEEMTGKSASKGCMPPPAGQLKLYHAYLQDVGSALRFPPSVAKQHIAALENEKRAVCEALRATIPNADRLNDGRVQLISARQSLLEALAR